MHSDFAHVLLCNAAPQVHRHYLLALTNTYANTGSPFPQFAGGVH